MLPATVSGNLDDNGFVDFGSSVLLFHSVINLYQHRCNRGWLVCCISIFHELSSWSSRMVDDHRDSAGILASKLCANSDSPISRGTTSVARETTEPNYTLAHRTGRCFPLL